ncbi:alkaline phosphatase family protein [Solwaraspora sp. WMMB335]|uniref:alkaline phosphatase family protein n=1 Tax=Solwaraspora sp. WMMB335 TaxID=3404118 RepID=UPI003B934EBF
MNGNDDRDLPGGRPAEPRKLPADIPVVPADPELLRTAWPEYGSASLADVLPGALAVLGVPGAVDVLGLRAALPGVRRVVVLLVDGLGWHQLPAAGAHAPTLARLAAQPSARRLTTGFPSTTPTSVVSLGTGAAPGAHGVLGFRVAVPGTDRVLNHIDWYGDPDPLRWQPLPTQLERATAAGVTVTVVSRPEFAGTGLTLAAYRGGAYRGASDADQLAAELLAALTAADGPVLVSGYFADLDRQGHQCGVESPPWQETAARLDRLLGQVVTGLPADAALLVTADHGQLNVPAGPEYRFDLDADPRLRAGVRLVAGEPRVRYLHTVPGAVTDVIAAWQAVLGPAAWVVERAELIESGLFGPVPAGHRERIGDVVAVCRDRFVVVASQTDPIGSTLVGYHGGITEVELAIPLLLATAA